MAGENNVIGLAMQLDVTDIKAGIKEVNQSIKSSKDEFNNATAGMDKWTKSSEGLNAKLKQLGTQLNGQQKIVAGYEAEIKRVSELEGDHSAELEVLKGKLLKAQTEVKKTQSAMSHYSDTLAEVTKAEKEENSTLGKLQKTISDQKKKQSDLTREYKNAVLQYGKNSKEAKTLGKQLQTLSKELDKNESDIKSADKAFDGLKKSLADVGQQATEKAVKGLAKVGAAVGGLVGSFLATAEGTREFRTNMGKVDTAFKDTGKTAKQAEDTYKKFYGILGDEGQATEATALLGELANSQADLNKWTNISTGIYAKFGDSLPIEGLIEAANETAKTGEVTGSLADALNWAGLSQDDFQKKLDGCTNEQERQKLITETLNKTYKDASNTYKETNKDIIASQEAQAGLSQAMADIGAKAEPLMTQVKLLGTKILEAFLPVLEKIIPAVQEHLPLVIGVVGTLTGAITALATAVGIAKLQTELATVATVAKSTAEKIAAGTTKALTLAQKGLNLAMKANPIGIVITLITALVAAFVVLWKKSDSFRNFWIKLWDGVKKATKATIDAIGKFFSACWEGIKKVWGFYKSFYGGIFKGIVNIFKALPNALKKLFSSAWDGAKNAWSKVSSFFSDIKNKIVNAFKNIPTALKDFFSRAWEGIKLLWSNPKQFFTNVKNNIVDAFKGLPAKLKEVGTNLIKGLWNGIKDMTSWITGKLKGFSENVLSGIKNFFGIHSPSTKMAEVGGYMAEGLANGIEDGADKVTNAAIEVGKEFGKGVNDGAKNSFKSFDVLSETIEKQKNKLSGLEIAYKTAVLTFGETSTEAYTVAKQIFSLSNEISNNEAKVNALNTSYENLNQTLAKQIQTEINNLNLKKKQLETELELAKAQSDEAARNGNYKAAEAYGKKVGEINVELKSTNDQVTTLTKNLNVLTEELKKTAKESNVKVEVTAEVTTVNTNRFEKALDKMQEKTKKWSERTGKYINQVGEIIQEIADKAMSLWGAILDYMSVQTEQRIDKIEKSIEKLKESTESEIETAESGAEKQLEVINKMYDNEEISAQEYKDQKIKIEEELAKIKETKNAEAQAKEKEMLAEKNRIAEKQYKAEQANAITQTIINGALAIVKGFAELGSIGGAINAVVQAGITGVQVATIASQKYVPMLAKGGIADGATLAMIGEAGKEAVLPLEKNTGWIDTLAEKLNAVMSKDMMYGMKPQFAYANAGYPQNVTYNYEQVINSPKSLTRRELYRDSKNLLALKG